MPETFILLVRGVNVGGKNRLSMADFRAFLESCGFSRCQTLLQSGNAVVHGDFETRGEALAVLGRESHRLDVKTGFFLYPASEWQAIIDKNPLPKQAADDPSRFVVHFLKAPVTIEDLKYNGPETLCAGEKVVYVYYPEGQARTALNKHRPWVKVASVGTARNWNTVLKLRDLALG